jgi:hypothetical protein
MLGTGKTVGWIWILACLSGDIDGEEIQLWGFLLSEKNWVMCRAPYMRQWCGSLVCSGLSGWKKIHWDLSIDTTKLNFLTTSLLSISVGHEEINTDLELHDLEITFYVHITARIPPCSREVITRPLSLSRSSRKWQLRNTLAWHSNKEWPMAQWLHHAGCQYLSSKSWVISNRVLFKKWVWACSDP